MFEKKGIFATLILTMALGATTSVSAFPLLTFNALDDATGNNGLSFDPLTNELILLGTLTGFNDVTAPTLESSVVELTANLSSVSDTLYPGYTIASFDNAWLSIVDGDGATSLLDGGINRLLMYGITDTSTATMTGDFTGFTGSLMNEFLDPADLFALELNFSGLLSEALFSLDNMFGFSADVYGSVSSDAVAVSVPEPGVLLLLGLGLAIVGFTSFTRKIIK